MGCATSTRIKLIVAFFCGSLSFLVGWLAGFKSTDVICSTSHKSINAVTAIPSSPVSTGVFEGDRIDESSWHMSVLEKQRPAETAEEKTKRKGKEGKGYRMERERTVLPAVLDEVFGMVHHPASPLMSELLLHRAEARITSDAINYTHHCTEVFLTRTGSLTEMPNKCLALFLAMPSQADPIPHTLRFGTIAHLTDRFANSFADRSALQQEAKLLPPLLLHLQELVQELRALVGGHGQRQGGEGLVVMVLNSGVFDLFVNFLCSLRSAGAFDSVMGRLVVFTPEAPLLAPLRALGVRALASPHLSDISPQAAGAYGDSVFGKAMWLKTSAVFLALHAGFDVLFQDVDIIWMRDVLTQLQSTDKDMVFMDDGARTPRFSPFYFNSGFYYIKHNKRTLYVLTRLLLRSTEISVTRSHQSTLTNVLLEAGELAKGLSWEILDMFAFASGYLFHHNADFIEKLVAYQVFPHVFHMCWTESRKQKLEYLARIGMWLLDEQAEGGMCSSAQGVADYAQSKAGGERVLDKCCVQGTYFQNMPH
ncbi:hypothetical protein EON64_09980 [archaeon]|nr:MAG: hypothetical protein EON64_09980 [archaeon]